MKINSLEADKVWDYENGFHWFPRPTELKNFLLIINFTIHSLIPGDVVELGVFKEIL